jgi:hypothetical protein
MEGKLWKMKVSADNLKNEPHVVNVTEMEINDSWFTSCKLAEEVLLFRDLNINKIYAKMVAVSVSSENVEIYLFRSLSKIVWRIWPLGKNNGYFYDF